ncbi:ABC-type branched-subunit amino acid transport system substrate-binding protein [Oxalobacteraceae bacterium GrIS 2.11]
MKKIAATASFITYFFTLPALAAQEIIVKIGHVASITGPVAHLGKDNENGARLAIEELNAKGGVINGQKVKFVLVPEDDGADPKQGATVAQKLVDAKVNGVVGHLTSGTSIPAAKIYSLAGIPQIAPSVTAISFTGMGYKSTFRIIANDAFLGGTLGEYAVKNLNAKTIVGILVHRDRSFWHRDRPFRLNVTDRSGLS